MKNTIKLLTTLLLLSGSLHAMAPRPRPSVSPNESTQKRTPPEIYKEQLSICVNKITEISKELGRDTPVQIPDLVAEAYDLLQYTCKQNPAEQRACVVRLKDICSTLTNMQRTLIADQKQAQTTAALSPHSNASTSTTAISSTQLPQIACPICMENRDASQCVQLSCGHRYCKECLNELLTTASLNNDVPLQCPECRVELPQQDFRLITHNAQLLQTLDDRSFQKWVAAQPNAKHCPTANCKFVFLNEEGQPQTIRCPQCNKYYCSACTFNHSARISCAEAAENRRVPGDPEAAMAEWKRLHTKQCPNCHVNIEKNNGCNHMTCKHCRYEFCWRCLGRFKSTCKKGCNLYDFTPYQQRAPFIPNNNVYILQFMQTPNEQVQQALQYLVPRTVQAVGPQVAAASWNPVLEAAGKPFRISGYGDIYHL